MLIVNIRKLKKGDPIIIRLTDKVDVPAIFDHLTASSNVVVYINDARSVFYCTEVARRNQNHQPEIN